MVEALRQGGHVVHIRHARTEPEGADQVSAVMGDYTTQRMLSEAGPQAPRTIGAGFSAFGLPMAAVLNVRIEALLDGAAVQAAAGRPVIEPCQAAALQAIGTVTSLPRHASGSAMMA